MELTPQKKKKGGTPGPLGEKTFFALGKKIKKIFGIFIGFFFGASRFFLMEGGFPILISATPGHVRAFWQKGGGLLFCGEFFLGKKIRIFLLLYWGPKKKKGGQKKFRGRMFGEIFFDFGFLVGNFCRKKKSGKGFLFQGFKKKGTVLMGGGKPQKLGEYNTEWEKPPFLKTRFYFLKKKKIWGFFLI